MEECSDAHIDQRAAKHSPLILQETAEMSSVQRGNGSLVWPSDQTPEWLRELGDEAQPREPNTWSEWVKAFTNLFSPSNRASILARGITILKQEGSQTVDNYIR